MSHTIMSHTFVFDLTEDKTRDISSSLSSGSSGLVWAVTFFSFFVIFDFEPEVIRDPDSGRRFSRLLFLFALNK